jgi:hypothetical protein
MRHTHVVIQTEPHSLLSYIPVAPKPILQQLKKITTSSRTVAASKDRDSSIRQRRGGKITSSLAENCSAPRSRSHVEDVHNVGGSRARYTRNKTYTRHTKPHSLLSYIPVAPKPILQQLKKITTSSRTVATSKDRDSSIRQRRGGKITSSLAENCSAPRSRSHVEDVHNVGASVTAIYKRHETYTRRHSDRATLSPVMHPRRTETHPATTQKNHHIITHCRRQQRSRLQHPAATWRQDNLEPG